MNERVVVVDLGSRHLSEDEARARAAAVEGVPARRRAHKIDSALRGNWAHEVAARLAAPAGAGGRARRAARTRGGSSAVASCCSANADGDHVPIADAMAADPRGGPGGSRPTSSCGPPARRSTVTVPRRRARRAARGHRRRRGRRRHRARRRYRGRVGGLGRPRSPARAEPAPRPPAPSAATSSWPAAACTRRPGASWPASPRRTTTRVTVLATDDDVEQPVPDEVAEAVLARFAAEVAGVVSARSPAVVVVLGGDTAAAVLGDHPMHAFGPVRPGAPVEPAARRLRPDLRHPVGELRRRGRARRPRRRHRRPRAHPPGLKPPDARKPSMVRTWGRWRRPMAITMGDASGVGPEIVLRRAAAGGARRRRRRLRRCRHPPPRAPSCSASTRRRRRPRPWSTSAC